MASSAVRDPCRSLAPAVLALASGLAGGCAPSVATLSSGVVHVSFTTDETCGFSNPYTVEARGCSRLDGKAVMCKGFGVIDGVLFAGGCEAPAELELLETQGTLPLSPPRSEATLDEPAPGEVPLEAASGSERQSASDNATPSAETKATEKRPRASSKSRKKSKTKKARRKQR